MERESYSIDDILSEVKKRREEQESALKEQKPAQENKNVQEKKMPAPENKKTVEQKKSSEKAQNKSAQKPPVKKAEQPKAKEKPAVKKQEAVKADEKKQPTAAQKPKAKTKQQIQKNEPKEDFESNAKQNVKSEKSAPKEDKADNNEMIDILKIADTPLEELVPQEPEKEKFFKTKKGKIVKAVIIILVLLIVAAGVFAVYFVNNMLNNLADDEDDDVSYQAVEYYNGMDFLQEDFPMIEEQSAYDVYSYKEYLKHWYQNGDPVRSSHVLNVLLIGEDTVEEEILDTSRADSAIIASVNVDTGTIHLTSVLRDLFVYYEDASGEGHYGKINESAMYSMSNYINTLERYYKISIDNYAVVNFASFPKIIDALGGVDINITTREINEINNNPYVYGDAGLVTIEKTFEGTEGVMRLDGLQALAYCRIRHIDSDNVRADRQKAVLNELFNKAKTAGTLDTVKLVNQLSQYTKTGYTKKELVSIGNTALRDGWLSFEIQTSNVPALENSKGGEKFPVYRAWIWLADIPKDAYELQQKIYGKSNIQLSENRPDYISMGSRY
ncbi:MAG: LCP family protein [Eubacterium sp.]|nr:LCP family protein [Eubacterium sp.]